MFDDLRKDSLENLIIDIRGNKGGGHYETNELLKVFILEILKMQMGI